MHFLYNIGIRLYAFAIIIASFFNEKAKEWVVGRKNIFKNLPTLNHKDIYWFHCASLGEFDQALPIINLIKKQNPSIFIFVTFFSPSGFLHYHKRKHQVDYACYLPIDTPKNARTFINLIKPSKVFFVKYEFWANYIFELKKRKIPIYSFSTILRPSQLYFKWYGRFFKTILMKFDYFFVQNQETEKLLHSISIQNVHVTGDTRFDRVIENKNQLEKNLLLENYLNGNKAFIIGSSWPSDERILLPFINELAKTNKIIIAPHSITSTHLQDIKKELKYDFVLYSELNSEINYTHISILILDTIGHLANAYSYGEIAYVGGGFSGNLHNILEPAVFGLPVIFGPQYYRFPEAKNFIENKIGFSVKNSSELSETYNFIKKHLTELSESTKKIVIENQGASVKITSKILN